MRIQIFFTLLLLLSIHGVAQELTGPDRILPGTLASFEIIPTQEAAWHIVSPSLNTDTYQVDTDLATLYFASPKRGRFTIVAGIVSDGKPSLLMKTLENGEEEEQPIPAPPISSLESWIKTQLPLLVKSNNIASEVRLVAESFEQIVHRIEEGNIQTASNAQSQLHITLIKSLALATPTAVTDWTPFLSELSRRLEIEFSGNIHDLSEWPKTLQRVRDTLQSWEVPKSISTVHQEIDPPKVRVQGVRPFRNLFSN